ncbi:MAG: hypothetical protein NZM29_04905, partial [Nitrospira sp.]|nr:hypothetical protein [Nitrospira sp.]
MADESLIVLKAMVQAARLDYDPTRAERAMRQAELEIAPTVPRAARRRLAQAAEALGLQILTRQLSVREALAIVEPESPLAIFAVTPSGNARWFLLVEARHGQGCLARFSNGEAVADDWLSAEDLAHRIGASSADTVVEWLIGQPATPLTLTTAADETLVSLAEEAPTHHGPPPFPRLLRLLRPEWRDLGMVVVFAIGVGLLSLAIPITAMAVVNTTALATLLQQLVVLCLALLIALSLASVLRMLQTVVVEYLQQRIFVRVVADLAHRLPRVDLRAFDGRHGPELVNRFFDVLTIQKAGATLLLDGVTVVLHMAIGLTLLAFYHHWLLGFDLFLIAGLIFI